MLSLIFLLLVVGVVLAGVLGVGTLVAQGYFYTEPGGQLAWRAPAGAAVLTLFYLAWCLLDVNTRGLSPQDVPYDTLFHFNRWVEMYREPVRQLWAVKKNSSAPPVEYRLQKYVQAGRAYGVYKNAATGENWTSNGVEGVLLEYKGEKLRFDRKRGQDGKYPEYVSPSGWVMDETEEGPNGLPRMALAGRLFLNLLLNGLHLGLWFVCLWLLLRFQWLHALFLAVVLWLVATLAVLPPLLGRAAEAAWQGQPTAGAANAVVPDTWFHTRSL